MIDVKKALSQRCYIIFDTNEQLVKFVEQYNLQIYMGIFDDETVIRIVPNDPDGYVTMTKEEEETHTEFSKYFPYYHHTELTITDDAE